MPNYRILTLKPFLENLLLGRYIPFTQLTAPVFYCFFSPKSHLLSVLGMDLYCWPWVKECFLNLSLVCTFAFPSSVLNSPQSRVLSSDSLFTYCPQQEISTGHLDDDRSRTKRARRQSQMNALVTSMTMGCTPNLYSTFLQKGLKESEQISLHICLCCHKNHSNLFHHR